MDTAAVGPGEARVSAAAIVAVLWTLARENHRSVASGRSAGEVFPQARAAAEEAFAFLDTGFGKLGRS